MALTLSLGGTGNDTLLGDDGFDVLDGQDGNVSLDGGDDDGWLLGGAGADVLSGQGGILDTAGYAETDAAVQVILTNWTASGGHTQGDTISDIQNLLGSGFTDLLTGSAIDNVLEGGDGNDTINGGGGNDEFHGVEGHDVLLGGVGNDSLEGANGADTLDGGDGNDISNGGEVAASFIFNDGSGSDVINDFTNNVDTIELGSFDFTSASEALVFATQINGDVVVDFGNGDVLNVRDTNTTALLDDVLIF